MDKVYLCVKFNKHDAFKCKQFSSYEEADEYLDNNIGRIHTHTSTMIPISKWIPSMCHKNVLNYKLFKIFIDTKICNIIQVPHSSC